MLKEIWLCCERRLVDEECKSVLTFLSLSTTLSGLNAFSSGVKVTAAYFPESLIITLTLKCHHTQDGDIIAPDLTPLKKDWQENSEDEEGEDGCSEAASYTRENHAKSAKNRLF